jgi:hypothetical protein
MKYACLGDVHGDIKKFQDFVAQFGGTHKLIAVGDFVDSRRFSIGDQMECLDLAIKRAKHYGDIMLRGNHEMAYLDDRHRCSGNTREMREYINSPTVLNDIKLNFRDLHYIKQTNTIVTHAGLHPFVLSTNTSQLVSELEYNIDTLKAAHYIGTARGGFSLVGGIWWCDFWKEFRPIEGFNQVFGHTEWRPKDTEDGIVSMEGKNSVNYLIATRNGVREMLEIDCESKIKTNTFNIVAF